MQRVDEIVIVSYTLKFSVSTEIVYGGRNRRSLNATMLIAERITIQLN